MRFSPSSSSSSDAAPLSGSTSAEGGGSLADSLSPGGAADCGPGSRRLKREEESHLWHTTRGSDARSPLRHARSPFSREEGDSVPVTSSLVTAHWGGVGSTSCLSGRGTRPENKRSTLIRSTTSAVSCLQLMQSVRRCQTLLSKTISITLPPAHVLPEGFIVCPLETDGRWCACMLLAWSNAEPRYFLFGLVVQRVVIWLTVAFLWSHLT